MDLYVLGSSLERQYLYDRYISLIWTERARAYGDFQFIVPADSKALSQLRLGTYLALDASKRMMRIENKSEKDGLLTLSGRSIESLFKYRTLAIGTQHESTDGNNRGLWAMPINAMWKVYDLAMGIEFYEKYGVETRSYIPNTTKGQNGIGGGDLPISTVLEAWDSTPEPLYDMLQRIAISEKLSFAYTRNHSTNRLDFSVARGNNRTSSQSVRNPVIFSPENDTLNDPSVLDTIENYANSAYVHNLYEVFAMSPKNVNPDTARGLNLREIVLKAELLDTEVTGTQSILNNHDYAVRQGYSKLNEHLRVNAIDGTVPITKYKYDVHYQLNDLVEMRVNGISQSMRVTEHVYTSDAQGDRSFPTLEVDT